VSETKKEHKAGRLLSLRLRAGALLDKSPRSRSRTPVDDARNLVQDLQIHQVELEMQNEELRRTQLELTQSRDRFRDLYDFAPAGYLTINSQGIVLEANLAAAKMLGVPRTKLIGPCFSRFVERNSQDVFYHHRQVAFSGDSLQWCELTLRKPDGTNLSVHLESLPIPVDATRIRQCRVALVDITNLKRAEAALQDAQYALEEKVRVRTAELDMANARLEQLLTSTPAIIYSCKTSGNYAATFVSKNVREQLGYDAWEFLEHSSFWADRIHPADKPDVFAKMAEACLVGKQSLEYRFQHKNGTYRWMRDDLTLVKNGAGQAQEIIGCWIDITERKQLEREVLEVSERERQRLSLDLHDDLCQQLAGMEFLNRVLERKLRAAGRVEAAGAKEIGLFTRRAITSARAIANGMSPVDVHPDGLIGSLQELASRTKALFKIDCRFQGPSSAPICDHVTQNHLYRIAQEAIRNAIRHGKARRIAIHFKAGEDRMVLRVCDNGRGFPSRPPRIKGLGLRIMEYRAGALGGSVRVRRSHRGGTEVICSIPAPPADAST
jgi:PAS domain S-box-containing protein